MRLYIFVIIFLIICPIIFSAEEQDFISYESLDMKFKLFTDIDLVINGENPKTDFLIGELSLFPIKSNSQEVSNIQYNVRPEADIKEVSNKIIYKWVKPTTSMHLSYEANVKTHNDIIPITDKINFPYTQIDPTIIQYLEPSKYIDINSDIKEKANELVSGESDYYLTVFKIAEWVRKEINYNLTTSTSEAIQKSSWVLENKEGVCDEITNLFISLLRSIGIPARFVSGVAYTSTNDEWGNHGWAEVYFPGKGWIPFDVTYGQYGFVDASHIVLKESFDSADPSLVISASSTNMNFNTGNLNLETELISKGKENSKLVNINLEPLELQVGPGSYVPIKIRLKNLNSFYVPVQIRVTKAPKIEESNIKMILLRPNEEKNVFFITQIPENIENNYLYTTVFEIRDSFGNDYSDKIIYSNSFETITKNDAEELVSYYLEKEEESYSYNIDLKCSPEKSYYLDYEKANIICNVKNIGNVVLDNLNVCLNEKCESFKLQISDSKTITFNDLNLDQEMKITAKSDEINVIRYVKLNSLNDPNLRISNLDYPDRFSYKENIDFKFLLSSDVPVKNVDFSLNNEKLYHLDQFSGEQNLVFIIPGKKLYGNTNFIELIITYEDENGRNYTTNKRFLVNIYNTPFYIKILYFIKGLF